MKKIAFLLLACMRLYSDDLSWEQPQYLSTVSFNASDPRIVMDRNGNLVAAWIENGIVVANSQPFQGSWGALPIQISEFGASSLELVMDSLGNATAIWTQEGVIQSASSPWNGAWTLPVNLSEESAFSPQIAVDSSGNIAAIWECNGLIQSMIKPFSANWPQNPDTISDPSSLGDSPQIAIGEDGTIVAVWHSKTFTGTDAIFTNQTTVGGKWFAFSGVLSNGKYSCVRPQVAVKEDGSSMAAWFRYDLSGFNYSNVIVQTVFGNRMGVWNDPIDLSPPGSKNPDELVLHTSYNSIGIGLVLWTNCYDYCTFSLEGSVYNSLHWIPIMKFVESNVYLYDQSFTVSPQGTASAAYMMCDSSSELPIVQAFEANTYAVIPNHGAQVTISNGGSNGYPRITGTQIGSNRYVSAVWLNNNGSNTRVQVANGQVPVIVPPTSLAVVQSFHDCGIFKEYYNTLSWQGMIAAGATKWLIFRNGIWIGETAIDVLEFIDSNVSQNEPTVYGVAIQLENGDQSAISTINFP